MMASGRSRLVAVVFLAVLAIGWFGIIALDEAVPPPLERIADRSTLVLDREGGILHAFLSPDQSWRLPVALGEVDEKYLRYLVSYEDKRFVDHHGVDGLAILRAAGQAITQGRIVSGASTLTMQLARMLEPSPRDWGAKIKQIARAIQIERRLTKPQILEAYLALAPFGGNLEGVRAASLAYFGKEPRRLTEAEAALLVALPRSPELTRPDRFANQARNARDKVLRLMYSRRLITEEALAAALMDDVPRQRHPLPRAAPHLARRLATSATGERQLRSTIDASLQDAVERLARRHLADLDSRSTIAVLVARNAGREILAYVGSADELDAARSGANDMVRAVRSPGSALKPFIYAMGFEDLAAHPETLMPDVAMRFGDYAPKNFDDFFRGEITAREALQASLNLPAVALLERVGPRRFARRLADAGVPLELPEGASPGLPIALGGVGISLEGLVTLYAALADGGASRALSFIEHAPADEAEPMSLTSTLGAYYVTRILLDSPPPPRRLAAANRKSVSEIAYKTGTSFGFRDAWAVGYDRDHTIGVWVGRPDGSYSPGRMGRDAAAPILFECFDLLDPAPAALPEAPPSGAILSGNGDLPANLKRFVVLGQRGPNEEARGPSILYPVDGADIEIGARNGDLAALILEAKGGALPLRWLVNGQPVESFSYRRQAEWLPDGAGVVRVTVIDREGRSASSQIWLK